MFALSFQPRVGSRGIDSGRERITSRTTILPIPKTLMATTGQCRRDIPSARIAGMPMNDACRVWSKIITPEPDEPSWSWAHVRCERRAKRALVGWCNYSRPVLARAQDQALGGMIAQLCDVMQLTTGRTRGGAQRWHKM